MTAFQAWDNHNVPSDQTDEAVGPTGGNAGDVVESLVVTPKGADMGLVTIKDGVNTYDLYVGIQPGTGSATFSVDHVPQTIPLGMRAVGGGWTVTTGPNVECHLVGRFT